MSNDLDSARADEVMRRIDAQLAHVWMVRTFLKHSEEGEEDEELQEIYRTLYDYAHALGGPWQAKNAAAYLKQARKKYGKLSAAMQRFAETQPEISSHTNFQMAATSLRSAVERIGELLGR